MQGFIFPNGKLLKVGYPFEPGCLVEEESEKSCPPLTTNQMLRMNCIIHYRWITGASASHARRDPPGYIFLQPEWINLQEMYREGMLPQR